MNKATKLAIEFFSKAVDDLPEEEVVAEDFIKEWNKWVNSLPNALQKMAQARNKAYDDIGHIYYVLERRRTRVLRRLK